jgi:serine/threonine protein kinase
MLCGTVPFKASNLEDLHKLILKGEFNFPNELSAEAQALVRGMIQLEPKARLTVPQILSHGWLKETNEDESDEEEENNDEEKDGVKDNSAVAGGQGNK